MWLQLKSATAAIWCAEIPDACAHSVTREFQFTDVAGRGETSGFRLFHHEVSIACASGNNSLAENLGHDTGRLAGTVHAVIG